VATERFRHDSMGMASDAQRTETEPGRAAAGATAAKSSGSAAGGGPRAGSSRRALLVVMCAGYFLVLLDVTIVNVALPQIGDGLGAGVSGLQWIVDGYALALAALLLAGGTIGDLRGHKRVVLAGLTVFGVGSLGCGLAPGIGVLVGARVAQGVGAALLLPGTLAIIADAFPGRGEQARAIGIWAGLGSVALPAGPLLGGALIELIGWRAVFLVNVPIVAIAGALTVRVVPGRAGDLARRVDRAGVLSAGLLLTAVIFAFIEAGRGGLDRLVVVAAVGAVLLATVFVRVERSQPDPMLPPGLFGRRGFAAANAVAGIMNLGTLGLLFLVTLYLQTVQGRSALGAGVAVVPLFAPLALLAPLAGRITGRVGPRPVMLAGLLLAAAGVGQLTTWQPDTPYLELLPGLLGWGVGLALLTPAAVAAAPAGRSGLASGINNTARQAGGAIGIAAFGAIAGPPAAGAGFLTGLHVSALITAALFVVAATVTAGLIGASLETRATE